MSLSNPLTPTASAGPERPAAIEIRIFWKGELFDLIELSPPRTFHVGDGAVSNESVDFTLPDGAPALGATRLPLVVCEGRHVRVEVPPGGRATRRRANETAGDRVVAPGVLLDGDVIDVEVGSVRFSIRRAETEGRCPRTIFGADDGRPAVFFAASLLGAASLVGAVAMSMPPFGLDDDEGLDRERTYLMVQYLDAAAERQEEPPPSDAAEASGGGGPSAEAARAESGALGRPETTERHHRASGTEPGADPSPATSRAEELRAAQTFGLIGLLSSGSTAPTVAPWESPGVGSEAIAGGLFGDFGESAGTNGLALTGLGVGGGQRGESIGIGGIGVCPAGVCPGMGPGGWGPGGGAFRGPGHVAKAPAVRPMGITSLSGSIPAEVIQRIVRQSFGRFRGCYEDGLRTNPNLEGRVTARFVIARDGSVANVQSGGTDLPDTRVVSCVLRAYSSLSFPAPKDGIVTVVYPLMFSPSA
jgi:hypothetical protein